MTLRDQPVRHTHAYDGVIDFDRVLRDPAHPTWLAPAYDSRDHLHPNDAGHAVGVRGDLDATRNPATVSVFSGVAVRNVTGCTADPNSTGYG